VLRDAETAAPEEVDADDLCVQVLERPERLRGVALQDHGVVLDADEQAP
jgi:hypothetical protein